MLGLFTKKRSIAETGLLRGMTDWHCHLLPGVDDGVQTMDEALQLLALYEQLGIREVWLTPHIMEDMPNTPAQLRIRFAELQSHYEGCISLHLASENMLDPLFEERLEAGDLLPIGKEGDHLLVETSYFSPPVGMDQLLMRVKSRGYHPILAHPERYVYMDRAAYRRLKDMQVKFQLNLFSLAGAYGPEVKHKAEWLCDNRMIDLCGTDTHRLRMLSAADVKTAWLAKHQSMLPLSVMH